MSMITQLRKPLIALLLGLLIANPATAGELKPTMKEMRLHYKQAIDATAAEQFNQKIKLFLSELEIAREFDFSTEYEQVSLEGLDKVQAIVSKLPLATDANLASLKQELKKVDELRKEYHKKVKPSVFDLLVKTFKQMF
jgi:soluble cytochrome b562